jgi:putative inorganic carbon (HCO3(-)) transporter
MASSLTARAGGLSRWELPLIAAAVLAGMVSSRLLPVAAGLTVLTVTWRLWRMRAAFWRDPSSAAALFLLALLPLNRLISVFPDVSTPQLLRLAGGIGLFLALRAWPRRKSDLNSLLGAATLIGVGLAALGAVGVTWPLGKIPFLPNGLLARLPSLLADAIHPNVLAGNLLLCLPWSAAALLLIPDQPRRNRLGLALAGAFMLTLLVLTQSRGALLGLLGMTFGLTLLWLPPRLRGWFGGVSLVAGAALLLWLNPLRVISFFNQSGAGGTLPGRTEIWSRALYILQDFPMTGVGMGLFGRVVDTVYPFSANVPGSVPHAHNLFLQVGVDLGLPGLLAWGVIYLNVWAAGWSLLRHEDVTARAWGAAILALQIALSLHGLVDAVVWGMVRPAPLLWAAWGLALGAQDMLVPARPVTSPPIRQEG